MSICPGWVVRLWFWLLDLLWRHSTNTMWKRFLLHGKWKRVLHSLPCWFYLPIRYYRSPTVVQSWTIYAYPRFRRTAMLKLPCRQVQQRGRCYRVLQLLCWYLQRPSFTNTLLLLRRTHRQSSEVIFRTRFNLVQRLPAQSHSWSNQGA